LKRAANLLFLAIFVFAYPASPLPAQAPGIPLTVEKIFAHGPIGGTPPSGISWSPDGKHLTYLDGGELVDLDPVGGKPRVLVSRAKLASLTSADGSEQDRDHRERYKMASYLWAPDSQHLLFDSNGRLWLYDLHSGTGIQVGFTDSASGDDPKFSPNGEAISFVRDHGLVVVHSREFSNPVVIAPSPGSSVINGEVDWVYEEELDVRSNYFWSPDSKYLAFLQMNETLVPLYPIEDWIPTHAKVVPQRYPQPGDANPDVRVGVVGAAGGKTIWVKLPIHPGQDYIPRFGWADRRTLWIETLTRDHKHRNLYFADAATGQARSVLDIADDKFLDDNYDMTVGNGNIVFTNWTDGHNHIYLYQYDVSNPGGTPAKLERQLTKGEFDVDAVSSVDAANKVVYYASNEGAVLEQQLWQVTFDGDRKQLTSGAGFHDGNFAPSGGRFVDRHSTRMTPATLGVCEQGGRCNLFWQTRAIEPYRLRPPQQLEVKAHDGTTLYATILLPQGAHEESPATVPLIVNPYGGPGPQMVANRWSDSLLFDELLAQRGFAVLHADNRGTGMRGREFAQAAYRNFGPVQLEDQLTAVDAALAKYPQLKKENMGWWGWSWGGTFTLYAMSHSSRFAAGVAVAPVTDWRNYDSIYTERYMGEPINFPKGYEDFSVINSADKLKGRLLIAHGTGDDNVHLGNSVQYTQKLIETGIPYDLQIYPRKTHSIAGPDVRAHLYNRILAHFEQYLKPGVD
jgi:dipeptidyl-peptidase 4